MAKTHAQIEAERKQKSEERRKILIENPERYQRDFDEAFKTYLKRKHPEIDYEDCDNKFDPDFREKFTEDRSKEVLDLYLKYNLDSVWDPDGDYSLRPIIGSAARYIRCQDDRILLNQIQKDSITNLPPDNLFGRFLIVEIDLSKPKRQIEADIMGLVDLEKKKVKVTGSHQELVSPPEPRDRDSSFTYKKMEVWKMVDEKGAFSKAESEVLPRLAKELCESEGWDESYGKFEDDPDTEQRVIVKCKALTGC